MVRSQPWAIALVVAGTGSVVLAADPPVMEWEATVSITDQLEGGNDVVVDAEGNVIVLGYLGVEQDFYVIRFDGSGDLLWARIIGGSALDVATGLTVDAAGDIYIAGRTLSSDFPVRSAYQGSKNGPSDAFFMKLAGGDGETLYSTYFGGSRGEWAWDIAVGSDGSVYLAGSTDSTDFETVNPIQGSLNLSRCFCEDAFVTRFSREMDTVLFSTYLGGGGTMRPTRSRWTTQETSISRATRDPTTGRR